jgi:hypothetical protein
MSNDEKWATFKPLNLTFTCDIKNDFNDGKRVSDALRNYSV